MTIYLNSELCQHESNHPGAACSQVPLRSTKSADHDRLIHVVLKYTKNVLN